MHHETKKERWISPSFPGRSMVAMSHSGLQMRHFGEVRIFIEQILLGRAARAFAGLIGQTCAR